MQVSDLLSYLPLYSAVVVGIVAWWFGRNGWMWAVLTFVAVFVVFILVSMPLSENTFPNGMFGELLPLLVLLLIGLFVRRLWLRRHSNVNEHSVRERWILGGILTLVVLAAAFGPLVSELQTISAVRNDFYLEKAVEQQSFNHTKPTAEELLNPDYLKRYGLTDRLYLNAEGYFAPNGHHWDRWPIETRIAAVLMLSDEKSEPSVWRIHRVLHGVDSYYDSHDKSVLVLDVINALLETVAD